MRVIIEPNKFTPDSNIRSTMESFSDDLDLHSVMTDLIAPALIGWGFHPASVYEYIEQDCTERKEDVVDSYNYSVHQLDKNNWDVDEWKA